MDHENVLELLAAVLSTVLAFFGGHKVGRRKGIK